MNDPKPYEIPLGSEIKQSAPHAARTAGPIASVLKKTLPKQGVVLEIASGSGEHVLHFARVFPKLIFQPSDANPAALASIEAWRRTQELDNLLPALPLDARDAVWPIETAQAILCINMIHVSPWQATQGLMAGAQRRLPQGAPLYLYGAYRRTGVKTAPSNEAFDQSLKARDPEWGLRTLEDVVAEAAAHSLALEKVVEMPANNLSVIFRKT